MNQRIIQQLRAVESAAFQLNVLGCQILAVQLGGREPVIWIDTSLTNNQIEAAVYMRETVGDTTTATWVAPMCGCQVRWTDEYRAWPVHNIAEEVRP